MIAQRIGRQLRGLRGTFAAMRLAILAALAIGCGAHAGSSSLPQPAAAPAATRWVPDRPTYLMASPMIGDAQRNLRDVIDALSIVSGVELDELAAVAQGLVGVDVLHAEPLAAIGIDVGGSWAVFSEDISPTFVVHLTAPDKMKAFLERQRARGLPVQTATVDQVEVASAELIGGLSIAWAVDGEWMWIHLALPGTGTGDATRWFTASHHPHTAGWSDSWAWASRAAGAAAGVVGFFDLHGAVANAVSRLPAAVACAKLAPSLGRVGFSLQGDEHHIATRLAIEIGPTDGLVRHVLAPPSGWPAAAARAAVAAQWNLDLTAAVDYLRPCLGATGGQLAMLDESGVRTARGMLLGFDPDHASGTGAVAFDLTNPAFFAHQLDRIPLRSTLERAQSFAGHKGGTIDIPFSVTIEYVLEQGLMVAALGEGLVAQVLAPGAAGPPPIFALDVSPPAMSAEAWGILLQALVEHRLPGSPGPAAKRAAAHLLRWRTAHVAVTAEAGELVLTASGDRM